MAKPKIDIHQEVTDKFIAALEAGTKPWEKDWLNAMPTRSTGEEYRGINVLLLSMSGAAKQCGNPHWITFKQAKELGGKVRKGEKGTRIVFYKKLAIHDPENPKADDSGKVQIPMLRHYTVFNVEQIDGLPSGKFPLPNPAMSDEMRDAVAEEALRSCGAEIREAGSGAFYDRIGDYVQLPEFSMFKSVGGYLATLAHELTHWTGAAHRLDRTKGKRFGDSDYAFEELVAEIGAAFICARLGIAGDHFESHAAYVSSWLKALKDDKKLIFKAAALAQTAADMVLANASADKSDKPSAPAQPAPKADPVPQPAQASFAL